MKLGVSSYSFSRYMRESGASLFDICRKAKEFGYDAVEFVPLPGEDRLTLAHELRALCNELGLDICAYTVGADLLSGTGEAAVEALCRDVDIAEALGAPLMRHDVCSAIPEGMTWQEAIEIVAPRIRAVTQYAKKKGIVTCTENHGYVFQDSKRVRALIEAVGDENYGWLVDMGNFMCVDEPSLGAVRVAAPYAVHVHAKDFHYFASADEAPEGCGRTRGDHRIIGTVVGHGTVPVADCLRVLRDSGYDGAVSLEFEGPEDVLEAIAEGHDFLKKTIESL